MLTINREYVQTRNATVESDREIRYIVIHYTGNEKDTASGNARYYYNNKLSASAHYFVDEDSIYQSVEDKNRAWHCGTKGTYYHDTCRNSNSIGIEMCTSGSYTVSSQTIINTAELTAALIKEYSIPLYNVIRHYDVTHKLCPKQMVEREEAWSGFKELVYKCLTEKKKSGEDNMRFSDVPKNDSAYGHIEKLAEAGIVNGFADGTFRPDEPITRREAAVIAANVLRYLGK